MTTPQQFGHAISLVARRRVVHAAPMRFGRSKQSTRAVATVATTHWGETGNVAGPPAIVRAPRAAELADQHEVRQVA